MGKNAAILVSVAALTLAGTAAASRLAQADEDGEAWLRKCELRLYRWPRPGVKVRVNVKTNALDFAIEAMERDAATDTEPEKAKFLAAFRKMTITSTVHTGTGKVETEVNIPFESAKPSGKAATAKMKEGIASMMKNCFQGLPFGDPTLLPKGAKVLGAEARGDSIGVTLAKSSGDRTLIVLNRKTHLIEAIEMSGMRMSRRYVEVEPGKWAPQRIVVVTPRDGEQIGEYEYRKVGDIFFPSACNLRSPGRTASFAFESPEILDGR